MKNWLMIFISKHFTSFLWTNDWWQTNRVYKFKKGDVLKCHPSSCGFGIGAKYYVTGTFVSDNFYKGDMYSGIQTSNAICSVITPLPDPPFYQYKRAHSKCNIQLHFKKVGTVSDLELTQMTLESGTEP